MLGVVDAYWRAANYLSAGQIYLTDNALLREPLRPEHVKQRLLGHWGTTPGLNFVYAHLNRLVVDHDVNLMQVTGPGHGGPALFANTWLEGSFTEAYPSVPRNGSGMRTLMRQFSFPDGMPSHAAPEVPGSINEGGELGYSLMHAFGAAFDNPDLVVACVIGDGEAETGPLAASWHANKFLDPVRDGAVLPILHLNEYKIANPTVLARIPATELEQLLNGYGYAPRFVEGHDPAVMHRTMASTLDEVLDEIRRLQAAARRGDDKVTRPRWPVIVLRTPKGWTGPDEVNGEPVSGTWRAHQVPLAGVREDPERLRQLEAWLRSYRPEELFDADGVPIREFDEVIPAPGRRLGATPHANGGRLLRELKLPPLADYAPAWSGHGQESSEPTAVLGAWVRDVLRDNDTTFRLFGPDETASNRLDAVFEVTPKQWQETVLPVDQNLGRQGRVLEVLSEHLCQGWLEGYLLTGRHGLFSCYEAFVHIVDSMFNQHAKWLEQATALDWRRSIASLNYLLSSHVWRQDHNGFSHQDPGFLDHVMNKKPEFVRVYLPPDTNTLLCVMRGCLLSRNRVNVTVAGKNATPQWLSLADAARHCARGLGIWEWAGNEDGDPDVVLACAGDTPTLEVLAATAILREQLPELRVRVVNVVDMTRLQPDYRDPVGISDHEFDAMFTTDKPVLFAYHGYPWMVHRLTYKRTNHDNIHVRGFQEEGTTTTPFDMVVRNDVDRFRLVADVIDRVPSLGAHAAALRQRMMDKRHQHHEWTRETGADLPEIRDWVWPFDAAQAR